jgi:23S rRNA (pseudouridine1915-N3)-methyltransferase
MKIFLFTVNHKKPSWLQEVQQEYHKRLPPYVQIVLQHISPSNKKQEAQALEKLTKQTKIKGAVKIALTITGEQTSSEVLAKKIQHWQQIGNDLIFYIGGADGLDESLTTQCQWSWSFSKLTFSHLIAQMIFSEQLYRAFSILQNHPYHLSHE